MQRRPHLQKFIFRLSVDVDVVNVVVVVVVVNVVAVDVVNVVVVVVVVNVVVVDVVAVADEDVAVTQINVAKLLSMSVFPRCCCRVVECSATAKAKANSP